MAMRQDREVVGVASRRYWRAGDAEVVVGAWKRSGETLSEFADRYGIHRRRLSRWAAALGAEETGTGVVFHPVRLVASERGAARSKAIEIVTAGGYRVRVPAGFAMVDLERVLRAIAVAVAGC